MNVEEYKRIITSLTELKKYLNEKGIYAKKRFGQNFLFDRNVIDNIINAIAPENKDIIEIGSGMGNLLLFYYEFANSVLAIEIDKKLYDFIKELKLDINLIHSDFLKLDLLNIIDINKKYSIVSNLPYSIASQIILKFLEFYNYISEVYLMVPEVLYKRIIAKTGTKDYSRFTILVNIFFAHKKLFKVKKNSFFPVPEIDSLFIKLVPNRKWIKKINDIDKFIKLLNIFFQHRRKKIKYIIKRYNLLFPSDFSVEKRIEEYSIDDIVNIFNLIEL